MNISNFAVILSFYLLTTSVSYTRAHANGVPRHMSVYVVEVLRASVRLEKAERLKL